METEQSEVEISPEVIYQQDKAAIDMQIATAKAYPRNVKRSTDSALAIVTMDIETAETCNYAVPRGGKTITGPSVHLARILAQTWGNMRIESKVVMIDQTHVTSESVCFDLESNLAVKTQVKKSIMQNEYVNGPDGKRKRTGKMIRMNDDMITLSGSVASSIAYRNAVYAVVPYAIINKVYTAAKQMVSGDLSDKTKLIAKRKQVFDAFKDMYSISEEEVLKVIGKAHVDHVTPDDIVVLVGIGRAIKDGDTTAEQAFKPQKPKEELISIDELKSLLEAKVELLNKKEFDDARRIIDNNETDSFKKLHQLLTAK